MPSYRDLQERRNKLASDIEAMRVEFDKRAKENAEELWPGDSEQQWERLNAEFDEVCREMSREKAREDVERRAQEIRESQERSIHDQGRTSRESHGDSGHRADDHDMALQAWCLTQSGRSISDEHRAAAARCHIDVNARDLTINLMDARSHNALRHDVRRAAVEKRVLSGLTGSAGGDLRPEGFVQNLEKALLWFGPMMQAGEIMTTQDGNDLPWPTANDTTNTGELLADDNTAVDVADPTFSQTIFKAWPYSSKLVRVPVTLLEDAAFDLASELGMMLGERLGRIINTHCTTGNGTTQPQGITVGAAAGKTTSNGTAIADTELIDLEHSVDIAYRTGAAFMMSDAVAAYIRKLQDGDDRFLWSAGDGGLSSGPGGLLLGRPVWINNDMASTIEASAKTMLFGSMRHYKIRRVRQIRLRRLVERYAEYDQEGFVAFFRLDGRVLNAGTNPIKYMVQAPGTTTTTTTTGA